MRFFETCNNGVTAIVSEEVYNDLEKHHRITMRFGNQSLDPNLRHLTDNALRGMSHLGLPVFTFVKDKRFRESPWFTGNFDTCVELIKWIEATADHKLVYGKHFYVPFSNGYEVGFHGNASVASEMKHVTTEQQFRDTFGISLEVIRTRAGVTD